MLHMQAHGHLPKMTSLEEVLKSTPRMEPKLIGYDETPVEITSFDPTVYDGTVVDSFKNNHGSKSSATRSAPRIISLSDQLHCPDKAAQQYLTETTVESSFCTDLKTIGTGYMTNALESSYTCYSLSGNFLSGETNKSATSHVHEICAANCWKPPLFECCNAEGPGHLML